MVEARPLEEKGSAAEAAATAAAETESAARAAETLPAGSVERPIVQVAPFSREHALAPGDDVNELRKGSAG